MIYTEHQLKEIIIEMIGFVDYVQHTGSNPMSITWRLENEIPAKYLKQTSKLIVS